MVLLVPLIIPWFGVVAGDKQASFRPLSLSHLLRQATHLTTC